MAQLELHVGISQPINDWAAADLSKDAGYGKKGLVINFGGPLSDGETVNFIVNMTLGYNAMDSESFGKVYANNYWGNDPVGVRDSLVSMKLGTYLYGALHGGLEIKVPIGSSYDAQTYIPLRLTAGPHLFAPPNKSTVKTAITDENGNDFVTSNESLSEWSYDIVGLSYQLGTGIVLGEKLSLRVDYFTTFFQIGGQIPNNFGETPLLFPKKFQSLNFSIGIIF
jgi:hypothetical protein